MPGSETEPSRRHRSKPDAEGGGQFYSRKKARTLGREVMRDRASIGSRPDPNRYGRTRPCRASRSASGARCCRSLGRRFTIRCWVKRARTSRSRWTWDRWRSHGSLRLIDMQVGNTPFFAIRQMTCHLRSCRDRGLGRAAYARKQPQGERKAHPSAYAPDGRSSGSRSTGPFADRPQSGLS